MKFTSFRTLLTTAWISGLIRPTKQDNSELSTSRLSCNATSENIKSSYGDGFLNYAGDHRLSLLKLIAAFAVVLVHTSTVRVSEVDLHSLGWWIANISDATGRIGSAMFVMVGGAILLGRTSEHAPWISVRQRFARLLPAVIFWSVFYFLWRQWMWGGITMKVVASDLLLGSPEYHLWFIYMMLGLYLLLPGIRLVVVGIADGPAWKYLIVVLAMLTWFASITQALKQIVYSSFVEIVPFFIVYFLAGYYLLRRRIGISTASLCIIAILSIAAMAGGVASFYEALQNWSFVLFYSNRSPFAMALTFCFFLICVRLPQASIPRWVGVWGASTLGVYAIHPFWIGMFDRWGWGLKYFGDAWPLMTLLIFGLSMLTSLILGLFPGVRRLVR